MIRAIYVCAFVLSAVLASSADSSHVFLTGEDGRWANIEYTDRCINLVDTELCSYLGDDCISAEDSVSHAEVDGCARFYTDQYCSGEANEVEPGSYEDLGSFQSVGPCWNASAITTSARAASCKHLDNSIVKRNGDVRSYRTVDNNEVVVVSTEKRGVKVPEVVYVLLWSISNPNRRSNFRGRANEDRFRQLDAVRGDERGHIVASAVGGPAEPWNLVPMQFRLNRGDGTANNWRRLERRVYEFLRGNRHCSNKWVEWTVFLDYGGRTRRPVGLTVQAVFERNNRVVAQKTIECTNTRPDRRGLPMCQDVHIR